MAERKHQGRQIRTAIRTRATPDQVWEAWTDPASFGPGGKVVAVRILSWGKPLPQEIEGRLQAALARLAAELGNGGRA